LEINLILGSTKESLNINTVIEGQPNRTGETYWYSFWPRKEN